MNGVLVPVWWIADRDIVISKKVLKAVLNPISFAARLASHVRKARANRC